MSILYGTTSDGNTLPVQVDEFGRLVAFGAQGPEGKPGPPGPEGPGAEGADVEEGSWTPRFGSNLDGFGVIEYSLQDGYFYRMGRMMTVWFALTTSRVTITNGRGNLQIQGLPYRLQGLSRHKSQAYGVGSLSLWGGFKGRQRDLPVIRLSDQGDSLDLFSGQEAGSSNLYFSDLDEARADLNKIAGSWSGLVDSL